MWESYKQSIATGSIIHAEFLACYEAIWQARMVKEFFPKLKVVENILKPIMIHCDNKAAVFLSSNNKSSGAGKHIDIKYFIVKDRTQDQTIDMHGAY